MFAAMGVNMETAHFFKQVCLAQLLCCQLVVAFVLAVSHCCGLS